MKLSEKYDLYIDDDLIIYFWNKHKDKLMQRTRYKTNIGYQLVNTKIGSKYVHRIIYETFNGEIPDGYEIDHINAVRDDNRLENLRIVTHKDNLNNPLTKQLQRKVHKGKCNVKKKPHSEFGIKFKEHYGITRYKNPKLYNKEHRWYSKHNKCSWEV